MVPYTEPVNRKILIIDIDRNVHETIRQYLFKNPKSLEAGTPSDFYDVSGEVEYFIASADRGDEGVRLALEAEMAGRPFAMAFIGEPPSPDSENSEIVENIWRDCPDVEIVLIMSGTIESSMKIPSQIMCSDKLLTVRKPLMALEIRQLARLLTGKWSYRHSMKQSYEKMFYEQKRRQSELENNVLRLQQEVIIQRRKLEIIENKFLRYKDTFERADCPLIVTSVKHGRPSGKIIDVNQCFCQLCGFSSLELKNMTFDDVFEEDVVASMTGSALIGNLKTRIADSIPVEIKSRRIGTGQDSMIISAAFVAVFQPVI